MLCRLSLNPYKIVPIMRRYVFVNVAILRCFLGAIALPLNCMLIVMYRGALVQHKCNSKVQSFLTMQKQMNRNNCIRYSVTAAFNHFTPGDSNMYSNNNTSARDAGDKRIDNYVDTKIFSNV